MRFSSMPTPKQTLAYMSQGAAMASSMCKAMAAELGPGHIARAATLELAHGTSAAQIAAYVCAEMTVITPTLALALTLTLTPTLNLTLSPTLTLTLTRCAEMRVSSCLDLEVSYGDGTNGGMNGGMNGCTDGGTNGGMNGGTNAGTRHVRRYRSVGTALCTVMPDEAAARDEPFPRGAYVV